MANISTEQLFKVGRDLRKEKEDVMDRQAANRQTLRNLEAGGFLTAEEKKILADMYPPRERKSKAS